MKKIFYLSLVIFGMIITGCEYNAPVLTVSSRHIVMSVGESTQLNVDVQKNSATTVHVNYAYSDLRDSEKPVFEISDFEGKSTAIHALNVGKDTLFVDYVYVVGISALGEPLTSVVVEVVDKK